MQKKLTISIDEMVYLGLHEVIGKRKISKFIESLIRPYVIDKSLVNAYREMAKDEVREKEALEWSEGLIGDINNDFLDMQLSALEDEGRAKILARPRIITQDNQKAYIKIGDEIPYMERTLGQQITTEVKFKDAAIELEVSPHTVGDEVFMDIVVARKTADWSRTIEGNPPLKAQALTTKVSVKSGQTFAVGGLSLEEEMKSTNAVPYFSRIPLLGWMFKKETKARTKRELIIFITPTIIRKES